MEPLCFPIHVLLNIFPHALIPFCMQKPNLLKCSATLILKVVRPIRDAELMKSPPLPPSDRCSDVQSTPVRGHII